MLTTVEYSILISLTILIILVGLFSPVRAHAEDSSDLSEKIHILTGLGIEFSDDARKYVQASADEMRSISTQYGFDTATPMTYTQILSALGTGKYDIKSNRFIPFTNRLYAFDGECDAAYDEFLYGIARISNGDITIENYFTDVEDATTETGTGTQEVVFQLNGRQCVFTARYNYDWLDCSIIDYVNHILEEQSIDKRVFCMFDGGQGFVVFFENPEWVKEFSSETGCVLSLSAQEAYEAWWN